MGPSVWCGCCLWASCIGWTCTVSVQMDRLVCSCLLQPRWHAHPSLLCADKYFCGLFHPEIIKSLTRLCAWLSSMRRSSKIRTCNIANRSWWMNPRGRHVHVMMHRYYRSNQTNRWSRLKVTLISFWLSITESALLVMAGSAISIPALLFGQHDRAALLWLTRWRITLSSSVAAFIVSPFLLANLHPCITTLLKSLNVTQKKVRSPAVTKWGNLLWIIRCHSVFISLVEKNWHGINSVSNFSNAFIGSWMDLLA